jgi:phosphate-selective porin OprO/OprP
LHPIAKIIATFAGAALLLLGAAPACAETGLVLGERGLTWQSPDGGVQLDLAGRAQLDSVTYEGLPAVERALKFRQVRININGEVGDRFRFMVEHEFAGSTGWRNVWAAYTPADGVDLKAGNFLVPFSLEGLQSYSWTTFMERSLANALSPVMGLGADASLHRDRWTVTAGWFRDPIRDDNGHVRQRGSGIVARATILPVSAPHDIVHLGASVERRTLGPSESLQLQSGPELSFAPTLIATRGLAQAKGFTNYGVEAAWIHRAFLIQAQADEAVVARTDAPAEHLRGAYVQAAWTLTGQGYDYNRATGVVTGVALRRGRPAWELAARYSVLSLNSQEARGGLSRDLTLGVNWYASRNLRITANYVRSRTWDLPGAPSRKADAFGMRFQTAF